MGADPAPGPAGALPEVALLERALAWTCGHLARVRPADLDRTTPCEDWDLRALLAHMEDSLDAFAEAAAGFVVPLPPARLVQHPVARVPVLQAKAGALLGSWTRPVVPLVRTGSAVLPARVLVAAAALEIAVHGWDVASALAGPGDGDSVLPGALALQLLPVAEATIAPEDRPSRFARPNPAWSSTPSERLLCFLGRRPGSGLR
ncbi:TIGR03086 family metal-binding protein [Nocardioides zeae]|uniref:TIGR03086 family metal-binding protein n=1 Tax=Nocardioides imazamoxiresistens TaxID=3231893 RepID=A0ABU3PW43_9ACTN|nr:TIGR03086 family metal-binding protein [Nocardioides zeae]MDT9593052.1 TIGR03086 family metal-binding protein [Nocardioides zeae]